MSEGEAIWSGYIGGSCWSRELIITPRSICGQEACSLPFSFLPRRVILPLPSPGLIMCLKQWGCLTLGCEPVDLHCEQWAETNLLPSQLLPGVSVVIRKFKGFNHSWLLMCRLGRLRRKATELILSGPFQPGSEGQMLIAAVSPLESSFLRVLLLCTDSRADPTLERCRELQECVLGLFTEWHLSYLGQFSEVICDLVPKTLKLNETRRCGIDADRQIHQENTTEARDVEALHR